MKFLSFPVQCAVRAVTHKARRSSTARPRHTVVDESPARSCLSPISIFPSPREGASEKKRAGEQCWILLPCGHFYHNKNIHDGTCFPTFPLDLSPLPHQRKKNIYINTSSFICAALGKLTSCKPSPHPDVVRLRTVSRCVSSAHHTVQVAQEGDAAHTSLQHVLHLLTGTFLSHDHQSRRNCDQRQTSSSPFLTQTSRVKQRPPVPPFSDAHNMRRHTGRAPPVCLLCTCVWQT